MEDRRWTSQATIFERPSSFGNETGNENVAMGVFSPSPQLFASLKSSKVLVIGAGGLGCEILKNLALSGISEIHVIDLDTIDLTNLNRQFLFREKDVGRGKAEVAAEFIMRRVPGCTVRPYTAKIQTFGEEFYRQFKLIVAGLDNIEARRWLNSTLVNMVKNDESSDIIPESIIPLIDGGTEGFKGQARVIIPKITSCFECTMSTFTPQLTFQICTIASHPRIAEHCIAFAFVLEWPKFFSKALDKDSPEDMQWIFERAEARAKEFNIEGVTYFKTMGVVKSIIPAVASTNAVIAAACTTEAIKLLSFCGQSLNTYFAYNGQEGVYSATYDNERVPTCMVCSDEATTRPLSVVSNATLDEFLQKLCEDPAFQLKKPCVSGEATTLYMRNPPSLEEVLRPNLAKPLSSLIQNGEIVTVTDSALNLACPLSIQVNFYEPAV